MTVQRTLPRALRSPSSLALIALSAASAALAFGACTTTDPKENFLGEASASTGAKPSYATGSSSSGVGGATQNGTGSGTAFGGGAGAPGTGGVIDFGCGPAPIQDGAFSKQALRSAAAACAEWNYCNFEGASRALETHTLAYLDDATAENRESAQQSFRVAMNVWEQVEVFQFGPLSRNNENDGKDFYEGLGIRDRIYAWPNVSRCKVEEQVTSQKYKTYGMDSFLVPNTGRGLFGLEYLLFYPGNDTACPNLGTTAKVYTDWQALSVADLNARKRDYAEALAVDVHAQAERLVDLWKPEGGNFRETFLNAAGKYPSEQEAMNVLAWALFYVEIEVKDYKLDGATPDKPSETLYATLQSEALRANLRGFRQLFEGCGPNGEGLGFDDWLREVGRDDLATAMIAAYDNAQRTLDELPPWPQTTQAQIDNTYQAIKALTDLIKADFFGPGSPLGLKTPAIVEGDND